MSVRISLVDFGLTPCALAFSFELLSSEESAVASKIISDHNAERDALIKEIRKKEPHLDSEQLYNRVSRIMLDRRGYPSDEEIEKRREKLLAKPNFKSMNAILREVFDETPPDPDKPHEERERILAAYRAKYPPPEWSDPMLAAGWERVIRGWYDGAYDSILKKQRKAKPGSKKKK